MCVFFAFALVFLYVCALDTAFAMYSGYPTTELFGFTADMPVLVLFIIMFGASAAAFVGYYLLYTGAWDSPENQEPELTEEERRAEYELNAYESMYM